MIMRGTWVFFMMVWFGIQCIIVRENLCPWNATLWEEGKTAFNKCTGSGNSIYHCILDDRDRSVELCNQSIYVQSNYCPVYNYEAARIDTNQCDLQYGPCPDVNYWSHDVYKYYGCLNKTASDEQDTAPEPIFTLPVIVGVAVGAVVLLIVVVILCVTLCRRKSRKKDYKATDVELEPLFRSYPPHLERIFNYLQANMFQKTKQYEQILHTVDQYGTATIIGNPGSGKSTLAAQVFRDRKEDKKSQRNFQFKVFMSVEEIEEKITPSCITYALLEDGLDQYLYLPSKFEKDKPIFDKLFVDHVVPGHLRLLITVKENTWKLAAPEAFSKCDMFRKNHLVCLSPKTLKVDELAGMFKNYLLFHNFLLSSKKDENISQARDKTVTISISESTVKEISKKMLGNRKGKDAIGTPLCLNLLAINRHLFASREIIYKTGLTSMLRVHFEHLKESTSTTSRDKDIFCILVFIAFSGGDICLQDIEDKESVYVKICSKYGVSVKTKEEIRELLDSQMEGYVYPIGADDRKEISWYIMHHDIMVDVILALVNEDDQAFFIRNVDMKVLFKIVRPHEGILEQLQTKVTSFLKKNTEMGIKLKIDSCGVLLQRIESEVGGAFGLIREWEGHVIMQSESFKKIWIKKFHSANAQSSVSQ